MSKIKKFWQEKYRILIPLMVLSVLGIAICFMYQEYQFDNYRHQKEVAVYQSFGGIKTPYQAIITYDLKKNIIDVKPKNKKISYDATPIYFKDQLKVLFPQEMLVAFPLKEGYQAKIYQYATYSFKDQNHYLKNGTDEEVYDHFFIYDGEELFFFPESIDLLIDGQVYQKLSGGSYISVVGNNTLIFYDYDQDTSKVKEISGKIITVKSKYININLTNRSFLSFNKHILLSRPQVLKPLHSTKG